MIFHPDSRISDLARNLRQKYAAFTIIIIIKRIFIHAPTSTSGVDCSGMEISTQVYLCYIMYNRYNDDGGLVRTYKCVLMPLIIHFIFTIFYPYAVIKFQDYIIYL